MLVLFHLAMLVIWYYEPLIACPVLAQLEEHPAVKCRSCYREVLGSIPRDGKFFELLMLFCLRFLA